MPIRGYNLPYTCLRHRLHELFVLRDEDLGVIVLVHHAVGDAKCAVDFPVHHLRGRARDRRLAALLCDRSWGYLRLVSSVTITAE